MTRIANFILGIVAVVGVLTLCGLAEGSEPNLIAHWKFDEGSGDTAYDSAGDNNGTVYGAVWTSGQIDGALSFDGNDYVDVAPPERLDFERTDAYTLSAWHKGDGIDYALLSKMDRASNYRGYDIFIAGGYVQAHLINSWTSNALCETGTLYPVNDLVWHHIAVTYDGSSSPDGLKIYVDGMEEATVVGPDSLSSTIRNSVSFKIAARSEGDETIHHLTGEIDDVRIYNRALSAEEIEELYLEGAGPIAHWKFDEGDGDIAYDSAGNNDGILNGDPNWVAGQIGDYALDFDGSGDYVSIGNTVMHNLAKGTFTAWVFPADLSSICGGRNFAYIIGANNGTGGELGLRVDGDGGGWCSVRNNVPCGLLVIPAGTFSVGSWHHVVMTWDGSYWKVYVNAVEKASIPFSQGTSGASNTALIGKGWDGCSWDGMIDDVRIYNRALSASEVEQLYWEGFSSFELAVILVENAIAEKQEALESINTALERESLAYGVLEEVLESGDYGDLNKRDIAAALREIESAIRRQQRSRKVLLESIEKLEDSLSALGCEAEPPEPNE